MIAGLARGSSLPASLKCRHTPVQVIGLQCLYASSRGFSSSAARLSLPPPSNHKRATSPLSAPSPISSASSSSSSTEISPSSPVNPPASTRPAVVETPSKSDPKTSSTFSYYFALGKAYFAFYKTGLKNVYANYKTSIPLRKQLGLPTYIPQSPWTDKIINPSSSSETLQLTRSDFQLARRSAYDIRRTIPFALILLVCGEFTPFVVLALGNRVTPLTCRMPTQLAKERKKRIMSKELALQGVMVNRHETIAPSSPTTMKRVAELSGEDVLRSCVVFGLRLKHELPFPGFVQTMLVNQVYRPRLQRWLDYLAVDDRLIASSGGVKQMIDEEVRVAVDERGGVEVGVGVDGARNEEAERKWLMEWLEGRK